MVRRRWVHKNIWPLKTRMIAHEGLLFIFFGIIGGPRVTFLLVSLHPSDSASSRVRYKSYPR